MAGVRSRSRHESIAQPMNSRMTRFLLLVCCPISLAAVAVELSVHEISERTVRVQLAPLEENGKALPAAPSTVLVPFKSVEKFRVRELGGEKQLRVGQLRVTIRSQPLTVSLRRVNGTLVQELTFEEGTNRAISFR